MYRIIDSTTIYRVTDSTSIPVHPDNSAYQEYLEWVASGNTPESDASAHGFGEQPDSETAEGTPG
ncbi:hypothetical protein LMG26685_02873 [Achromobacter mucicolens]|nr:hypothetical protein LMG26685_02873 [Achromobacter mucicolens]